MIVDQVTLIKPGGTQLVLGVAQYDANSDLHGFTEVTATLNAAPLVVYSHDLPNTSGGLVRPGRRAPREVVLEGLVVGTSLSQLNSYLAQLEDVLDDHGDQLVAIRYTPQSTTLELLGTREGSISYQREGWTTSARFRARLLCPDPVPAEVV